MTNAFTFTASGTNGGAVAATLQLQDGPNNLGLVCFVFPLPNVFTFANTNVIAIPSDRISMQGAASAYPSPWWFRA